MTKYSICIEILSHPNCDNYSTYQSCSRNYYRYSESVEIDRMMKYCTKDELLEILKSMDD